MILGGIMNNIDYKNIQTINVNVTKKLLKYISKEIQKEEVLDEIQFFHEDFVDHNLAFNIWLSFDFMDKSGKSFIDKFLDKKGKLLTSNEREILIERNKSNISLFEVIEIDKEFIKVMDLFQHKYHTLWEPDLSAALNENDLIFGRVADLLGAMTFIGDINYLPISARDDFLRETLMDFNELRKTDASLTIQEYLKNNSMELYSIYTNCIYEIMEMEDDINSIFYDELNEFQGYLSVKSKSKRMKKHLLNLVDFFEYYLIERDLSLYDIDGIDFNMFFIEAIENSFILSLDDLNSYISTFKTYLLFLSNKDPIYKEAYKDILNISKSRFQIAKLFKDTDMPFKLDNKLCTALEGYLDDYSLLLTIDFDKLILYILNNPLDLTKTRKHIKRKDLLELNNIFEFYTETNKKAPNQIDFPLIDMFYNFALELNLVTIKSGAMFLTPRGSNYLRLRDEEKYTIFFNYIWDENLISRITGIDNIDRVKEYKSNLFHFLSSLKENVYYKVADILPSVLLDKDFFPNYYPYLQYIKIIEYNLYPNYEIKITSLGKAILNYLNSKNRDTRKSSVISLDYFKNTKQS